MKAGFLQHTVTVPAGMGETCSHIASLLWVISFGVEKRDSLTVTQKSAYWVLLPSIKSVP